MELSAGTVNSVPALGTLLTVTTTFPVVTPVGTVAVMLVALHAVVAAVSPLNFTVLDPLVAPKPVPVRTTEVPARPDEGVRVETVGTAPTVNVTPALAVPATVTVTLPVAELAGTVTVMLVFDQAVAVAVRLLKNLTVLLSC